MKLIPGAHLPGETLTGWKLAAVFIPFLFPLGLIAFAWLKMLPGGAEIVLYLAAGLWLLVVAAGLLKQFPTWTLPAMGVALYLAGFYTLKQIATGIVILISFALIGARWPASLPAQVLLTILSDLIYVVPMLLIVSGLLALLPSLRRRVRQDWTLLSFLVYGMAIPPVLSEDPYRGLEPYEFASLLVLAAGTILFLLAPHRWQRLLVLLAGMLLMGLIMSLGVYRVFPAQSFASPDPSFRLWEALQPALELPALLILLCIPAALPIPPAPPNETLPATE